MAFIANLVARLGMDTSEFEKGTDKAKRSLKDLTEEALRAQKQLAAIAEVAAGAETLYVVYNKLTGALKEYVDLAVEMERSQVSLNNALKFSAGAGDAVIKSTEDLAVSLAKQAGMTTMAVRGIMRYETQIGILPEQLEIATKMAIGYNDVTGRGFNAAVVVAKAALGGHADRVKNMGLRTDGLTTAEEVLTAATKEMCAAWEAHKANLQSMPGQYDVVAAKETELKAKLGAGWASMFLDVKKKTVDALTTWAAYDETLDKAYAIEKKRREDADKNSPSGKWLGDLHTGMMVYISDWDRAIAVTKAARDLGFNSMNDPGALAAGKASLALQESESAVISARLRDGANQVAREMQSLTLLAEPKKYGQKEFTADAVAAAKRLEDYKSLTAELKTAESEWKKWQAESDRAIDKEIEAGKTAYDQLQAKHATMVEEVKLAKDTTGSYAELKEQAVVAELAAKAFNGDLATQKKYVDLEIADQQEIARIKADIRAKDTADQITKKLDEQHDAMVEQANVAQDLLLDWKKTHQYALQYGEAVVAANGDMEKLKLLVDRIGDDHSMQLQADRLGQTYNDMKSTWESNMDAMLWSGQSFGDSMKNIFKSIIAEVINMMVVEKAAKSFAGMATGVIGMVVGGAAGGGINAATGGVNYGSYAVKHQGGIAWDSAPRLHRGLAADEFPAILQQGETVTPKSGVQATVNIINQSSQPVTGHVQKTAFDGKSYVTSVVLEDFASNGRIAQALGR